MKLIVGLGNPGSKHARNRHNVGFMAADAIASEHGFGAWRQRFQGMVAEGRIGDERCIILKPGTYMNESGRSVGAAVRYLKISPEDVIVLYDEIDLAPGKLKVKTGGGNAGHNGLRSLSAHMDNDYVRVRIGVGHPGNKQAVAGYVLRDFPKSHLEWLDPLLAAIAEHMPFLVADDASRFLGSVASSTQQDDADDKSGQTSGQPPPDSARAGKRARKPSARSRPDGKQSAKRPSQADLARKSARSADVRTKTYGEADKVVKAEAEKGPTAKPEDHAPAMGALAAKLRDWLRGKSSE